MIMVKGLLLDTDVLVDYLRGLQKATHYLDERTEPLFISTITVAELYAGVREGKEQSALDRFMLAFEVVPVDAEIAKKGGLYRRKYGPSHGTGLADALIAATTEIKQARLVTLNERHFPMLEVHVPYQKPK